jgi:CHAT domain-containing protein
VAFLCGAAARAQTGLPEPGSALERSIARGQVHTYSLQLPRDQVRVVCRALPPGIEITVKVIADNGGAVKEAAGNFYLAFSAAGAAPGGYTLEISARGPAPVSGQYIVHNFKSGLDTAREAAIAEADADYYAAAREKSPADAAALLEKAAALYAQAGEPQFQASALGSAAQLAVRQSDWSGTSDRYQRSAAAWSAAGDGASRARALASAGAGYSNIREYSKAIDAASEALSLARQYTAPDAEAASLNTLATAYSRRVDARRALDYSQQGLTIARANGNLAEQANQLAASAGIHRTLGNYTAAISLYEQARKIHHDHGSAIYEATLLNNIGSVDLDLGDTAKALEHFQQTIALSRPNRTARTVLAAALNNSAGVYLKLHQPAKAMPLLEEALAIYRESANRWDEASVLTNVGRARALAGDREGATAALVDALALRRETGDPFGEAQTRYELARVERARGNPEGARIHAAAAIELVESLRNRVSAPDLRSTLLASVGDYYELHVDVLMKLGRIVEARDAAERGRARVLLDVLSAAGVPLTETRDANLAAREEQLRRDLGDLSARRTSLLRVKTPPEQVADLDRRIETAWTSYQALRSRLSPEDPPALDLEAVRREALGADDLLLEYSLGEARSYLWVVSQTAMQGFELPGRARIEEAARAFWDAAKSGVDAASMQRASAALSQSVLAPAAPRLGGKRLLIVADGALQYVPFAALADPAAPAGTYRPLLLRHEVIHEPSASALALLRRTQTSRTPAPHALAVFADPVFEADDPRLRRAGDTPPASREPATQAYQVRAAELRLTRLPASRAEGEAIARLTPEAGRWLAVGFEASREAATSERLGEYRMLHFATHGVIESAHPELSALALSLFDAQGRSQDGFLRLYEIYNLKIRADLVVLSACQTALGKEIRGEGLVGLARGFMHAGAPRVAASLWKVDDRATSELMRLFYAAMLGPQKKSPSAALRAAQLALARDERWQSPYYWAAFVLQGEWR